MTTSGPHSSKGKDALRKTADSHFQSRDQRAAQAKQEARSESVAADANTARLRALRLAKEDADREAARVAAQVAPKPASPKRPG